MMPDREKVIREKLDEMVELTRGLNYVGFMTAVENANEILALQKEHEAVEPYQHDAVWLCGNCEKEVVGWDDDIDGKEYRYPFCRQCGQAVKWE